MSRRALAESLYLSSAEGGLSCEGLSDHQLVHLRRALVGKHRLEVVGVPQDRVLQSDPGGTEKRAALPGDRYGLPDTVELAETDLLGSQAPGVLEPPEVQREQHSLAELQRHVRQLRLGQLVAGEWLVEDRALTDVRDRRVEAVASGAERAEDDAVACLVEAGQGTGETDRPGKNRGRRQPDVVEDELGGHAGAQRHLALDRRGREARCVAGNEEPADIVVGLGPD